MLAVTKLNYKIVIIIDLVSLLELVLNSQVLQSSFAVLVKCSNYKKRA